MAKTAYERIMNSLTASTSDDDVVVEKTAAETAPKPSALDAALADVRTATPSEPATTSKVAAEELSTMAKHAAEADLHNLTKQASLLGQHVADGFMSRMAVYQNQFEAGEKTAQEKIAAEIQEGASNTTAVIYKTAADLHYQGQQIADHLVQSLRSEK